MITFHNPGNLNIELVSVFGISAKDSDNPIGYFGTGLKYAIAVAIRNNCDVSIKTNSRYYNFHSETLTERGQDFQRLVMTYTDDKAEPQTVPLPFTTDLGRNWELWMAFREFYCNAKDESGGVCWAADEPDSSDTFIRVSGMDEIYTNIGEYFLQSSALAYSDGVEIHPGKSKYVYYHGVRAHELNLPSAFTYNIVTSMILTEDRTFMFTSDIQSRIANAILALEDEKILNKILSHTGHTFEDDIEFQFCHRPMGETFQTTMAKRYKDLSGTLESARHLYSKRTAKGVSEDDAIEPTSMQQAAIDEVLEFLHSRYPNLQDYPIVLVETLGRNVHGLAKDNMIFLSTEIFRHGKKYLASTILEEYIHLHHGYADESRGMQTFLFDELISHIELARGRML